MRSRHKNSDELTDALRSRVQPVNAVTDRLEDQEAEWARQGDIELRHAAMGRLPLGTPRYTPRKGA